MGRQRGPDVATTLTGTVTAVAAASVTSQPHSPWAWAVIGTATGLLVSVLFFAPARWLANLVQEATSGRIQLNEPRGTVWRGSAQLILTGGAGSTDSTALPTRIDWRLHPRWDGFLAELSTECCIPQPLAVRARAGWGSFHIAVSDGVTHWPATLSTGLGTPWNTLQFDGDLQLATQGLSVEWVQGRLAVGGRAELRAQRLSSRLSTIRPMGSYRITVQGGSTTTLQLDTLEGSLQLSGNGQWVGTRLHFSGVATAAPEREIALSNLLNIIGRRNGPRSLITIG